MRKRRDPCGDGNVQHPDSLHVDILAVILYSGFARCYPGGIE